MKHWRERRAGFAVACAAVAAVVSFASPAVAVDQSSTSVQATPSAATVGQAVQLTATITCPEDPSPGLGVTFFDGGDIIATAPVSTTGLSTLTTNFATTGTHTITAAYNGNDDCGASNDTTDVTVSAVTPPPPPPDHNPGWCFLCDSPIGFHVGNVHNVINIH